MITDALLNFLSLGGNLSMVGAPGADIFAPNTIDLLGTGVGTAPASIYGNSTVFGQADGMGVGGLRPELVVTVGTSLATVNASTLTVQLQGAPDLGAAGGYQPGTYTTFSSSGAMSVAQLTAGTFIFRSPWLPPFPANARPRYLRLRFAFPAGTDMSAGTIASALVTLVRDDYFVSQQPRNYAVQ